MSGTTETARESARPAAPDRHKVELTVNGQRQQLDVESWVSLLDLLRDRLGLTGTKKGCDQGQCGACTVLVGGARINSCLTLAVMHDGAKVTTVEGLATGDPADGGRLHPLQQAFIDRDAFQCGYCTPGQLCSGVALLDELRHDVPDDLTAGGPDERTADGPDDLAAAGPDADVAVVQELMSGNVCRCGAYPQITQAVLDVLAQERDR